MQDKLDRILRDLSRVHMKHSPIEFMDPLVQPYEDGGIIITVRWIVPDRDSGRPVEVRMHEKMPIREALESKLLHSVYERMLRRVYEHEFDESFHFDQMRVYDPHGISYQPIDPVQRRREQRLKMDRYYGERYIPLKSEWEEHKLRQRDEEMRMRMRGYGGGILSDKSMSAMLSLLKDGSDE